jgi:hypothetical protein
MTERINYYNAIVTSFASVVKSRPGGTMGLGVVDAIKYFASK